MLGVLGKHGREHARDKGTIFPNGAHQTRRRRIEADVDLRYAALPAEMTTSRGRGFTITSVLPTIRECTPVEGDACRSPAWRW